VNRHGSRTCKHQTDGGSGRRRERRRCRRHGSSAGGDHHHGRGRYPLDEGTGLEEHREHLERELAWVVAQLERSDGAGAEDA